MAATASITPTLIICDGKKVVTDKYIHLYKFNVNCARCGCDDVSVQSLVFKCLNCGNEETATEHEKQ